MKATVVPRPLWQALLAAGAVLLAGGALDFLLASRPHQAQPCAQAPSLSDRGAGAPCAADAGSPPPAWHLETSCKIFILDFSEHVAPEIGIDKCNISDPEVWPPAKNGEVAWSLQRMELMPHTHYQHAGPWWLGQALRNASALLTDDIDEACLVWVDTYCYHQWWIVQRHIALRQAAGLLLNVTSDLDRVSDMYVRAVAHVTASERYKRHSGRDFVFALPIRGGRTGAPFHTICGDDLLRAQVLVPERGYDCLPRGRNKRALRESHVVPYNTFAGVDLSVPVLGSDRPTLLYMFSSCADVPKNCGRLMRYRAHLELEDSGDDVQVSCSHPPTPEPRSYSQVQRETQRSRFCLLPPGDTQSSNRLSETIVNGCVPVFIGPPWHDVPFIHGQVDWTSMALFMNITNATWWDVPNCQHKSASWVLAADVKGAVVTVPDVQDVVSYLRQLSPAAVQLLQEGLERERPKFFYGVPPGRQSSALADIVFTDLIATARRVQAGLHPP